MNKETKLKPSYASSGQADEIIDLFRRMSPKKIDSKFIVDNKIATASNAFRTIDLLKWFGIINEKGEVNQEVLSKLKLAGGEREKYITDLIKTTYKDLFDTIDLNQAKKEDIINYFIRTYNFGYSQSKVAMRLFLHLCQKYNIPISNELKKKTHTSMGKGLRRKTVSVVKTKKGEKENKTPEIPFMPGLDEESLIISIKGLGHALNFKIKNKEEFQKFKDETLDSIYNIIKLNLPDKNKEEQSKS